MVTETKSPAPVQEPAKLTQQEILKMMPKSVSPEDMSIIEQMLRDSTPAQEPGSYFRDSRERIIDTGSGNKLGAKSIVNSVDSAGWVWVYHTETGEPSRINRNMLLTQLKKKIPETGKFAFSLRRPIDSSGNPIQPKSGTFKCWLHKEDPRRAEFDKTGFPKCKKSNLLNEYEVDRHMQRKHPTAYKALEKGKKERFEAEDREIRRSQLAAFEALAHLVGNNQAKAIQESVEAVKPSDGVTTAPQPIPSEEPVNQTEPEIYISDKDRAAMARGEPIETGKKQKKQKKQK